MTALAECLIHGKGVEKNPERAAGLLHAAIAFDHPLAFNLLGDALRDALDPRLRI